MSFGWCNESFFAESPSKFSKTKRAHNIGFQVLKIHTSFWMQFLNSLSSHTTQRCSTVWIRSNASTARCRLRGGQTITFRDIHSLSSPRRALLAAHSEKHGANNFYSTYDSNQSVINAWKVKSYYFLFPSGFNQSTCNLDRSKIWLVNERFRELYYTSSAYRRCFWVLEMKSTNFDNLGSWSGYRKRL